MKLRNLLLATLPLTVVIGCAATSGDVDDTAEADSALNAQCADYDDAQGAVIARNARKRDGKRPEGHCYRYVKNALEASGIPIRRYLDPSEELSAYSFARWAKSSPRELAAANLAPLADPDMNDLPLGSVIVWGRGVCGYSPQHGHIEIVVAKDRACSDFCGRIKRGCGTPDVFVPVDHGGACR
jgi:hypothetical protein